MIPHENNTNNEGKKKAIGDSQFISFWSSFLVPFIRL